MTLSIQSRQFLYQQLLIQPFSALSIRAVETLPGLLLQQLSLFLYAFLLQRDVSLVLLLRRG